MPPGPPREWRPSVERGLAVFNALVLIGQLLPGAPTWFGWFLCVALALALIGFLSRAPRRVRAFALVPSGLFWLSAGVAIHLSLLTELARPPRQHPWAATPWMGVFALGLLFIAVGALTLESAIARIRRSSSYASRMRPAFRAMLPARSGD